MSAKITIRPRGGGVSGIRQCTGCPKERDVIHTDRCPQISVRKDAFMISWVNNPYSLRHAPWHDERRTLSWVESNLSRLLRWAGITGCTGRDQFDDALREYRHSMESVRRR